MVIKTRLGCADPVRQALRHDRSIFAARSDTAQVRPSVDSDGAHRTGTISWSAAVTVPHASG